MLKDPLANKQEDPRSVVLLGFRYFKSKESFLISNCLAAMNSTTNRSSNRCTVKMTISSPRLRCCSTLRSLDVLVKADNKSVWNMTYRLAFSR